MKKRFPEANYKVYETESGCIYFTDGKTCWVKTGVEIAGLEHIEYLPIMDYKGFIVREIITEEEIEHAAKNLIDNDDLPF